MVQVSQGTGTVIIQEQLRDKRPKNSKNGKEIASSDFWPDKHLNMRVWSWLRMNAGGVLNTCKSNEALKADYFGLKLSLTEWRTGE